MSKLGEGLRTATGSAKDGLATAMAKASETGNAAKKKAADALDKSRDVAARSVQSSKKLASKAAEKSTDTIDKNPLVIVAGGLALGAIIGALLPKSSREKELLSKTGEKLNQRARDIAEAAKEAGTDKVNNLGLNGDAIREQFRDLVSKASEAVKAAGQAAGDAARKRD